MSCPLFGLQRRIGEELLAAGWHASSIAVLAKPGSAWVLFDSSRRIRVRMSADLIAVTAEATTALPASRSATPVWRLRVHHAPGPSIVAALLAAPMASAGGTPASHGAVSRALRAGGMRPDRSRLVRALGGFGSWYASGGAVDGDSSEAIWTAPYRARIGGWQIHSPAADLEATPSTPAAVLTPLITAATLAQEATK